MDKEMCDKESDSEENYSFSDESLSDTSEDSEVTNVTARPSTSSSGPSQIIEKTTVPPRSQSTTSTHQARSTSSVNSIGLGQRSQRWNMSFTNFEMMRIERDNQNLLKKIMTQQRPVKTSLHHPQPSRLSSSAINRKKLQRRIEEDNMKMLRRINAAKSCVVANKTTSGHRVTSM